MFRKQLLFCLELIFFVKRQSTEPDCSEKRDVFQYHFTSWPDHWVPRDTAAFVMFHHKLRAALAVDPGPVIVHCRYVALMTSGNL